MDQPTKSSHGYDVNDLNDAAEAHALFGDDELERYCKQMRQHLKDNLKERAYYSITTAAQNNIKYLRDPVWKNPFDHIEVIKLNEGPDARVVAIIGHFPMNSYVYGKSTIDITIGATPVDLPIFYEYTGPTADAPEYIAQVNSYPKR